MSTMHEVLTEAFVHGVLIIIIIHDVSSLTRQSAAQS
jgi:hypothetical protein